MQHLLVVRVIYDPPVFITMEKGTVKVTATFLISTRSDFVVEGMVLMLFPTMAFQTSSLQHTSLLILADKSTSLPISTKLMSVIAEDMRFSSEVLPVMSIVALGLVMLFVEGTPLSLEIEHVEVSIFLHEMDDPSLDVSHGVCKRAVLSVFTVL